MKISIITINYNNAIGLSNTVESVINQNGGGFEYLIIDGGSTDSSVEIIKGCKYNIDYWISERDNGVYSAMNKGIVRATGEYIIFLNSGDCFVDKYTLEKCLYAINNFDDVDIFYADILLVNQAGGTPIKFRQHPAELNLQYFKNDTINHQASLIKRSLFGEFGLYPECYRLASDFWLFLLSLLKNKKYHYLPFPMIIYDFTGISAQNNFNEYKSEQHIIWKKLVPLYAQISANENEKLREENAKYKHITSYKIVKLAIELNKKFQALRKL